jgi:Major intrinsic protein
LFLEMFLTSQLVLVVFMLAVEKHRSTFLAPVGIGLTLFVGNIVGVYYTGASLNPARSFGPQVIMGSFPGYHWIYCTPFLTSRGLMPGVGPFLGAIVSTGLYTMMKVLDYEKVNGTQDRDDTVLVAHIVPRPASSLDTEASDENTTVVKNCAQGADYFKGKPLGVTQLKPKAGPLNTTQEVTPSTSSALV